MESKEKTSPVMDAELESLPYFQFNSEKHTKVTTCSPTDVDYYCGICLCSYKYEFSARRHFLRSHVNRAYIQQSDLLELGISVNGHHTRTNLDEMFSCNSCRKLFQLTDQLADHVKQTHKVLHIEPGENEDSGATDSAKISLQSTKKSAAIIITCPQCKAEFDSMRSLKCHMRYHKGAGWNRVQPASIEPANTTTTANRSSRRQTLITKAKILQAKLQAMALRRGLNVSRTIGSSKSGMSLPWKSDSSMHTITNSTTDDMSVNNHQSDLPDPGPPRLRERTCAQKKISMFRCTICQRTFNSYGNMTRHRRLTHDSLIKRKATLHPAHQPKRSQNIMFSQPVMAKKFYSRVSSNIAFNVKNCIHGNLEHVRRSESYIEEDDLTENSPIMPRKPLGRYVLSKYNIKVSAIGSKHNCVDKHKSSKLKCLKTRVVASSQLLTGDSAGDDVYNKPQLWKFLCTVCLQYFPNTLELFTHQDTVHKRVKTAHMEVIKEHSLPLQTMSSSQPTGYLPPHDDAVVVEPPIQYTCTKCRQKFTQTAEFHSHLVLCGKDLLKPITLQIPTRTPLPELADAHATIPGSNDALVQRRITDHFNVKKRRSRLVEEVKEQLRIEAKLQLTDGPLSPPTANDGSMLSPRAQIVNSIRQSDNNSGVFTCPYCSIVFKYRKVFTRHIEWNCEMRRRISSPNSLTDSFNRADSAALEYEAAKARPYILLTKGLEAGDNGIVVSTETTSAVADTNPSAAYTAPAATGKLGKSPNTEDPFVTQSPLAQARVLAKFIHPARTCGPCFTCRRPNMARRYIHLKQRSSKFVEFVMSKHKSISLQSCICKACESKFRTEYDRRRRKNRRGGNNKISRRMQHQANSKPSKLPTDAKSLWNNAEEPITAECMTSCHQVNSTSRRNSSRGFNKITSHTRSKREKRSRKAKETSQDLARTLMEKIFPSEHETETESSRSKVNIGHEFDSSVKPADGLLITENIIDVEKEMSPVRLNSQKAGDRLKRSSSKLSAVSGASLAVDVDDGLYVFSPTPPNVSPSKRFRASIDLPEVGPVKRREKTDSRLESIMKFVGSSPNIDNSHNSSANGGKSSLSEIVNAVTLKVKEDPSLAQPFTDAIQAAAGSGRYNKRSDKHYRGFKARGSSSMPSLLSHTLPHNLKSTKSHPSRTVQAVTSEHEQRFANKASDHESSNSILSHGSCKPTPLNSVPNSVSVEGIPSRMPDVVVPQPTTPVEKHANTTPTQKVSKSTEVKESVSKPANGIILPSPPRNGAINSPEHQFNTAVSGGAISDRSKSPECCIKKVILAEEEETVAEEKKQRLSMTSESYQHMVEIIEHVATGKLGALVSTDHVCDATSVSEHFNLGESHAGRLLDCANEDRVGSMNCTQVEESLRADITKPEKNLRLANIITKLSSQKPGSSCTTSPTESNKYGSVDSGFTSLSD